MLQFIKNILGIKDTDYNKLIQNGAQIIDVRSPQEYKSNFDLKQHPTY